MTHPRRTWILIIAGLLIGIIVLATLAWSIPTPFDHQLARLDFVINKTARDEAVHRVLETLGDVDTDPIGHAYHADIPVVAGPLRQRMLAHSDSILIDEMAGSRDLYFHFKDYHSYSIGFMYVVGDGKPHAPGWSSVQIADNWFLVEESY